MWPILLWASVCLYTLPGCGPTELEPASTPVSSGIFDGPSGAAAPASKSPQGPVRKVLAHEVLHTRKYDFLDVQEMSGERYWVATSPGNHMAGGVYQFSRGLYKTGYRSDELNRTFEDLYLVSDFSAIGGTAAPASGNPHGAAGASEAPISTEQVVRAPGALAIGDVLDRAAQLAGSTVRVTGFVHKVNPDIMNRHWIHLRDGSRDAVDFVVTTEQLVPVGHVVTLEGMLAVNRDFGAGYQYDVIIEQGQIIP